MCRCTWSCVRFMEVFRSFTLSQTDTRCPNSFCLFVLGVTLKPWCRATHRFSFKWQSDIPILTVSPSSFSLFSLSVALFLSFHSPPNTPTYTNTHKHTHTNTHALTNENWLCWSWRNTTAALLITRRQRSLWTQLFQWCGQTPISIATFLLLPRHAK